MQELISQLLDRHDLSQESTRSAVNQLLSREIQDEDKARFLVALREKGETPAEISYFVETILEHSIDPGIRQSQLSGPAIDIVGTGGDRLNLFNISTTSIFILAAGGAIVIKHGNRGITSKSGGADVLEALGIRIDLDPPQLRECVSRVGLGFIFAQKYHPAFAAVGPVRKRLAEQGIATIFNKLGPLLNPSQPDYQLAGVFTEDLLLPYAEVLRHLGRKRSWIVHSRVPGRNGADELTTLGVNAVTKLERGEILEDEIDPVDLGFGLASIQELQGGDAQANARILRGILNGEVVGPKRDTILLNAAAGFVVAGLAESLAEGLDRAATLIENGEAVRKLEEMQAFQPALA